MQNYEIDNFIGIFPNALSKDSCERIIEHYEYVKSLGRVQTRKENENSKYIDKDNETYFLMNSRIPMEPEDTVVSDMDHYFTAEFGNIFWKYFDLYKKEYGVLESTENVIGFKGKIKIQKTLPGEGYHVWHCEQCTVNTSTRLFLVILYLNDVAEGGETEFLYQHKRVAARQGTLMICPGNFTHTHRGNPPLTGVKYIMNTWVEFIR